MKQKLQKEITAAGIATILIALGVMAGKQFGFDPLSGKHLRGDLSSCGNGVCEPPGEGLATCPADCTLPPPPPPPLSCDKDTASKTSDPFDVTTACIPWGDINDGPTYKALVETKAMEAAQSRCNDMAVSCPNPPCVVADIPAPTHVLTTINGPKMVPSNCIVTNERAGYWKGTCKIDASCMNPCSHKGGECNTLKCCANDDPKLFCDSTKTCAKCVARGTTCQNAKDECCTAGDVCVQGLFLICKPPVPLTTVGITTSASAPKTTTSASTTTTSAPASGMMH